MKKIYITILSICVTVIYGCGEIPIIEPTSKDSNHIVTIYAIGDSLTIGYQLPIEQSRPSQLYEMLQKNGFTKYRIVNAGRSGDTSEQVKERVEEVVSGAVAGDIAILTIGGNDGLRKIPVEIVDKNIRDIIQVLKNKGMNVVIGGMKISSVIGTKYTTDFAKIYSSIAGDTNSILIPFILKGVALKGELNLPDMIHPNEKGYKIIAETVLLKLDKSNLIKKE